MRDRKALGGVDIIRGQKSQPRRLPLLTGRNRLFNHSANGLSVEHHHGIVQAAGVHGLKSPTKQSAVEFLGRGQIRRDQVGPNHFSWMMFGARRRIEGG